MTLTNRLLLFFIGTLAVILAGFSSAVYILARQHLHHRVNDRLDAAIRALVAAAEVGPDGVEWEPAERAISFNPGDGVVWQVSDGVGRIVDSSLNDADPLPQIAIATRGKQLPDEWTDDRGRPWRLKRELLRATKLRPGAPIAGRYAEITITAAVPLGPTAETLSDLAAALAGLSLVVAGVAGVGGYFVCRRALAPVARMATAARGINAADFDERLPVAPTRDELADLGRSFNDLLDRLHESFERQRRFTGDASHQIRTPLAAILGQSEVALRRDRPAEEYRAALTSVQRQAGQLARIVDALLFLARVDSDAGPPPTERLDLNRWLPEHLRCWADHARASDLRANTDTGPAWVQVPPALLGELVNNLLDNAIKYSDPATPITIQLRRDAHTVSVAIEDRGCGIDATERSGLFRPFFRSAEVRRRGIPGVGLGLAVAARLAKAFGGEIVVTSEPGRGSTFEIRLPTAQ
jgi:signal transduction histidine kinase